MSEGHLSDALVGDVVAALGLAGTPARDAAGLAAVYRAWCLAVPWDNVQKRITVVEKRPVLAGAEPDEFFRNFLAHGTGGTCWPSSGAWHALLRALGFDARRVVGAMHAERWGLRANHGSVIVRADNEEWLADSSMLNERPLPLRPGEETRIDDPLHPMRALPNDRGLWTIHWAAYNRDGNIPCMLFEDDVPHSRYLERYEISRAEGFSYALVFRRNRTDGVLSLGTWGRTFKDRAGAITVDPDADTRRALVAEGGLSGEIVARLPADEPERDPPVHRHGTAAREAAG